MFLMYAHFVCSEDRPELQKQSACSSSIMYIISLHLDEFSMRLANKKAENQ
jgi:hypothetical protein